MSNEQLLAITKEARQMAQEDKERERKTLDCPNDGTPLQFNARRGVWACEHGDYSRPGVATG